MILLLDNLDSFVHNLARYLRRLGFVTQVIRSHETDAPSCDAMNPLAIILSPGPRRPEDAGCTVEVIQRLASKIPMLGVCLGHQAIGYALGASVVRCGGMHGRASRITHDGSGLFKGCPIPMTVGRYHSLAIDSSTVPSELRVTATTESSTEGSPIIMAVQHQTWPLYGVQFHPESVLSEDGSAVLANFLRLATEWNQRNRLASSGSNGGSDDQLPWVTPSKS